MTACLLILIMLTVPQEQGQAFPPPGKDGRISLQFRNMNIQDVLKTLSMEGNIKIVTSKTVQGNVTIFVDNVSVMQALNLVVEMQGFAYYKDGDIIKVVSNEEYKKRFGRNFRDRVRTEVVQLHHAPADQVLKTVFQLKSNEGNVIADARSNSLILVDLPAVLSEMKAVIARMDVARHFRAFSLRHISVQSIADAVKSMVSPGAKLTSDPATNQLILVGSAEEIKRVEDFLKEADVSGSSTMEIFSLQYADAEEIAKKLESELTPGLGSAVIDKATNKLLVRDLPDNLPFIRQLVTSLDQKTQQVLIEAKIIQIVLNESFKMGVDWSAVSEQLNGTIDISSQFKVLSDNDNGGRISATGLDKGPHTLDAVIEALQGVGKTDLLSNPRITCVDGQEAHILVGSSVPYKTIDTRDNQGVLTTFEKVVTVEVGVKLNVTPKINDDGFITMKIRPEVSNVTSFTDNIPVIEKSESETTVIVKDGITIIIGGLIKDQKIKNESSIPILGDIPLLGGLFSSTSISNIKTELVILIRPQIISGAKDIGLEKEG